MLFAVQLALLVVLELALNFIRFFLFTLENRRGCFMLLILYFLLTLFVYNNFFRTRHTEIMKKIHAWHLKMIKIIVKFFKLKIDYFF